MIEVLKQALEALEIAAEGGGVNFHAYAEELRQAIKELENQEPVAWRDRTYGTLMHQEWQDADPLYTHPPQRTEQEPVQVSPLEFVEMVMEKEHLIGKPIFWAEWPNKEKNT